MKKRFPSILLLCMALMLLPTTARAEDGSLSDTITYQLTAATGELVISGTGEIPHINEDILRVVQSVTIEDGITGIGSRAFYECANLTNITIPDSVTSIGDYTFFGCANLTSITIPGSVTSIGDYTFFGCTNLTSIIIPDSVTSIGDGAFYNCINLTSMTIPSSMTSIGKYTFCWCISLTSITIPSSVTAIGDGAFELCASLMNVYYAGSEKQWGEMDIESVRNSALINATIHYFDQPVVEEGSLSDTISYKLTAATGELVLSGTGEIPSIDEDIPRDVVKSVIIEDGITGIGYGAFYDCANLTGITIPDSVTRIDDYAFYDCANLTGITIPDSVTSIGNYAFYGCITLTSIIIPDSVTSIGDGAFFNCISLTSITIPNSVTGIGDRAFLWCTSLTNITIPDNVTSIGSYTFYGCNSLNSITIPVDVTSIGDGAFELCTNLTDVYYTGSEEQWEQIDSGYNNDALMNATIHYPEQPEEGRLSDTITYRLILATGELVISGTGEIPNIDEDILRLVQSVTIEDGIIGIGSRAFYGCTSLTRITIPDSVTSIGARAFFNCTNLTDITIPGGMADIDKYAFCWCTSLTDITIPDSVTSIGDGAFEYCTNLTSITIPDSVTNIGWYAFAYCTSLTDVYYAGSEDQWGQIDIGYNNGALVNATIHYPEQPAVEEGRLSDTITYKLTAATGELVISGTGEIPSIETYIPSDIVQSVTIEDGITGIGSHAFSYCKNLTNITVPNSVTGIGDGAFLLCTDLRSMTIPDSVTSIGDSAFLLCTDLRSITIPDGVTSIESYTFYACNSLTDVYYAGSEGQWSQMDISIGNNALANATIHYPEQPVVEEGRLSNTVFYKLTMTTGELILSGTGEIPNIDEDIPLDVVKSVIIEDGITGIGSRAFSGCTGLTSITIPGSVIRIGDYAFYGCNSLTSITIPNSVTGIGDGAFERCTSLTSITIPDSVTSIGWYAFEYCTNLTSIAIPVGVTSIESYTFYGCNSLTDVYYAGSEGRWGRMGIKNYGNDALVNATIHYGGNDPQPDPVAPVTAVISGTDAKTVAITVDDGNIDYASIYTILAASYDENGRMTRVMSSATPVNAASGTFTVTFNDELQSGDTLFFLNDTIAPVCPTVILE